jgi:dihydrolipoamide dehydrogenase
MMALKLKPGKKIMLLPKNSADHIIIYLFVPASNCLEDVKVDYYRKAMTLATQPKSLIIVVVSCYLSEFVHFAHNLMGNQNY